MAQERSVLRRPHSAQLKAQVLGQCAEPGASMAQVAMSHALKANIVHGWRKLARERGDAVVAKLAAPPAPVAPASMPQFVAVSMAQTPSPPAPAGIQIELRRGATLMKITWPIAAAADCAAWMRELLR